MRYRYITTFLISWLGISGFLHSVEAQLPAGGGRRGSAPPSTAVALTGAWYKLEVDEDELKKAKKENILKLISKFDGSVVKFEKGGEFVDYDARLVAGRWTALDSRTLHIGSTTLGFGSRADPVLGATAPIICAYVTRQKLAFGDVEVGKDNLRIADCQFSEGKPDIPDGPGNARYRKLEGLYFRLKLEPKSGIVGKWFDTRSGSVIQFSPDGDFIVQGVRKAIVWEEPSSGTAEYAVRTEEVDPDAAMPDGKTLRRKVWLDTIERRAAPMERSWSGVVVDMIDKDNDCLAEAILDGEEGQGTRRWLIVQGDKLVDRTNRKEFQVKVRLYDSLSLVVLPGKWMISGDQTEGVVAISRAGSGRPVTGLCRYRIIKGNSKTSELELSGCSDPVDGLPPDTLVLTSLKRPPVLPNVALKRCE